MKKQNTQTKAPKINPKPAKGEPLHIELTDEQRKQLIAYVQGSGDARLQVSVTFSADVERGVIAPATFLVGNAI